MKPLKIIFPLLIIILLTACVGQKQLNADEFLKKYSLISEQSFDTGDMIVTESANGYKYSFLHNGIMICLFSGADGVITQCTVTAADFDETGFNSVCQKIIEAFTGFSAERCAAFLKSGGENDEYHLVINNTGAGKTMILNKVGSKLNSNGMPTLKREVENEDIARPTLSDAPDSTSSIKQ